MEYTNVTDLIIANTSTGMIMIAARKVSFNWPMWMLLGFAALMVLNLLTTEIVYCCKNCMKNYTLRDRESVQKMTPIQAV